MRVKNEKFGHHGTDFLFASSTIRFLILQADFVHGLPVLQGNQWGTKSIKMEETTAVKELYLHVELPAKLAELGIFIALVSLHEYFSRIGH